MKSAFLYISLFVTLSASAQGPYAPAANNSGTTAMYKDSSAFISWATSATINRGFQDIADANSDTTNIGNESSCLGKADANVLSLGDHGSVTLQFKGNIYNGTGPDFAVFENAFNATFLELAFVEVSSNGIDFYRFPSHSLTDTSQAVGSFGAIDPTNLNNLAGKYQANYGTPFDLNELKNVPGLDIQNISHIKLIDVVGSLDSAYATRDSQGRKINDQYPTPYASGGFDLDALGVVYLTTVSIAENNIQSVHVHPNPSNGNILINEEWLSASYQLVNTTGKTVHSGLISSVAVHFPELETGVYFLQLEKKGKYSQTKVIIQ